jgi:uncharacterized damage-inducible protein DinB
MGTRAQALADQFDQAFADLAKTVEAASEKQWAATCGDEQWSVAATAQHVGAQLPLEREYLSAAAEGRDMPAYTWEDINGMNEKRAKEQSAASKADVLKLLRDGGASMAAYVRGLSDEQLDRTASLPLAGGAQVTTEQLLTGGVLIEHATAHLASIRAAAD